MVRSIGQKPSAETDEIWQANLDGLNTKKLITIQGWI